MAALTLWQRLALMAWIIIAILALGRAALIAHPHHRGCYDIFAGAGRHWLTGQDLYSPCPGLAVFRYSPLVAALLAPLGLLPDMLGSALLRLINLCVYLIAFAWWTRSAVPLRLTGGQRAALWLLVVPLSVHSLIDVQTNALTVGLLLLATTAAAEQRWTWCAIFLLFACSIKVYPIALALLLLAMFPRRLTLPLLLAAGGVLALPFLLQAPEYVGRQYGDWLRWGLNDRHVETTDLAFRDLRLLCRVWLVPLTSNAFRIAQLAAAAGIAALCLWQRSRNIEPRRLLTTAFGLACGWMMVFGPATEHTTYIFLAPTLAWVVLESMLLPCALVYRAAALASFLLFTAAQLCLWLPDGARFHHLAPHPIAGLLLMGSLTATGLKRDEHEAILLPFSVRARAQRAA